MRAACRGFTHLRSGLSPTAPAGRLRYSFIIEHALDATTNPPSDRMTAMATSAVQHDSASVDSLSAYLNEIRAYPLLTRGDEAELARRRKLL